MKKEREKVKERGGGVDLQNSYKKPVREILCHGHKSDAGFANDEDSTLLQVRVSVPYFTSSQHRERC